MEAANALDGLEARREALDILNNITGKCLMSFSSMILLISSHLNTIHATTAAFNKLTKKSSEQFAQCYYERMQNNAQTLIEMGRELQGYLPIIKENLLFLDDIFGVDRKEIVQAS